MMISNFMNDLNNSFLSVKDLVVEYTAEGRVDSRS